MIQIIFSTLFGVILFHFVNSQATSDGLIFCCSEDIVDQTPIRKRISQIKCEEYSKDVDCRFRTEIFGGTKAKEGDHVHMVAIGFNNPSSTNGNYTWGCGGSLISDLFVLTAAHCAFSKDYGSPVIVRLGTVHLNQNDQYTQQIGIQSIVVHPSYRGSSTYHDIALVKLVNPVNFNKNIRPICLYQSFLPNITAATATGWGTINHSGDVSEYLLEVTLSFYDQSECIRQMGTSRKLREGIKDGQICAGSENKDTCKGDSGGPLAVTSPLKVCVYDLVGITSFGRSCAVDAFAVYTRVFTYLDWIENVVWPRG